MLKNKKQSITLEPDECAIVLKEDRTIDIVFPNAFNDSDQVPDHVLAFFGAAFALRDKEWILKLHALAKKMTNETQQIIGPSGDFEVN